MVHLRCVIPGCQGKLGHRFPTRPKIAAQWKSIIKSPKLVSVPVQKLSNYLVCYRHFVREDYCKITKKRRRLMPNAVPTQDLICPAVIDTDVIIKKEQEHDNADVDNKTEIVGKKFDPQEYLNEMERVVTKMIHSGSLKTDKNWLKPIPAFRPAPAVADKLTTGDYLCDNRGMEEEHKKLLTRVRILEEELKMSQEKLKGYDLFLKTSSNMLKPSIFEKWSKLNNKQQKIIERQLNKMIAES